jgi:hypothetical protein
MSDGYLSETLTGRLSSRISVSEISQRLEIGRQAVYALLTRAYATSACVPHVISTPSWKPRGRC